MFKEIKPTEAMVKKAKELSEGEILIVYKDHNSIRMETEEGLSTYVWRDNNWRRMMLYKKIIGSV